MEVRPSRNPGSSFRQMINLQYGVDDTEDSPVDDPDFGEGECELCVEIKLDVIVNWLPKNKLKKLAARETPQI